ncbi:MAG TPA: Clp protease N-terminal domain-containing protein [Phycisphaerae bacterium]|nr:Clp protease N-terminal domain-containing protein [Phycisphaerae bacterium]
MFERFTDRARKVMALANQEAMRFNHEYIGTEHILLGLLKEGSGVGANVLKNLEVDVYKARVEVEKLVKSGPPTTSMDRLPQTPRAKKVIELAIIEARGLNHNYVGTEHLLLGLLAEEEGVAAQVLLNLGVKLEEVREEVRNLLGESAAEEPDPQPANRTLSDSSRPGINTASMNDLIEVLIERFDVEIKRLESEKNEFVRDAQYEKAAETRDKLLAAAETKRKAIKKILGYEEQP